jgi:hypothetical protein
VYLVLAMGRYNMTKEPKTNPRRATTWDEVNDTKGKTNIVNPEQGPENKGKK